jgi:hypothetical protein
MDTQKYLSENRESIITMINREIKRVEVVYDRKAKASLKEAMIVYKNVLETTLNAGKAKEAVEKVIRGNMRVSAYAHLSEASIAQLPSSMRRSH